MPVITVEAGKLTKEQKIKLADSLTKDAAEVMNIGEEHFMVFIKENDLENIAVGGTLLTERK